MTDKVIIATCVVTDRAKSKWVKEAKKVLSEDKKLYLTGCSVFDQGGIMNYEKFYEVYKDLEEHKENITLLPEDPLKANEIIGLSEYDLNKEIGDDINLYTKKFIVIQNGCDTHCTFCLTIVKRGPNRNRELYDIIDEIKKFENSGGKEIVITGINLAAWGSTNTRNPSESKFSYLLEEILKQTTIPRIRISSIGPEFIDDHFFEVVSDTRFMPHFHFSIQSFSDKVLKSMNRNYDSTVLDNVLTKIRKLDRIDKDYISIGADIIVGFPGESDEDIKDTLDGVKKYNITKLHAFPFSAHKRGETVPASRFPGQLSREIKTTREHELLQLGNTVREKFIAKNKGKTWDVLVEEQKDGKWVGWTPNYIQVNIEGDYNKGDIVKYKM